MAWQEHDLMANVIKNIAMAFVPLVFVSGCIGAAIETTKECPEASDVLLAWELLGIDATKFSDEQLVYLRTVI